MPEGEGLEFVEVGLERGVGGVVGQVADEEDESVFAFATICC